MEKKIETKIKRCQTKRTDQDIYWAGYGFYILRGGVFCKAKSLEEMEAQAYRFGADTVKYFTPEEVYGK